MRNFLLLFLSLLLAGASYGQGRLQNMPRYDTRALHFGFSIGVNYMGFKIDPIRNLAALPEFKNVKDVIEPGYTISIISNLRLGHHFDLRFLPGFASTVRNLEFQVLNDQDELVLEERSIESAFMEFPLHLKFKSERIGNYRLYVVGGVKYALDLSSDEDSQDDRVFKLQQDDFGYQAGIGIDIYFEYFKFSPQLIATFGATNLRVADGTLLVAGIESIQTRSILLNLTFE